MLYLIGEIWLELFLACGTGLATGWLLAVRRFNTDMEEAAAQAWQDRLESEAVIEREQKAYAAAVEPLEHQARAQAAQLAELEEENAWLRSRLERMLTTPTRQPER